MLIFTANTIGPHYRTVIYSVCCLFICWLLFLLITPSSVIIKQSSGHRRNFIQLLSNDSHYCPLWEQLASYWKQLKSFPIQRTANYRATSLCNSSFNFNVIRRAGITMNRGTCTNCLQETHTVMCGCLGVSIAVMKP